MEYYKQFKKTEKIINNYSQNVRIDGTFSTKLLILVKTSKLIQLIVT